MIFTINTFKCQVSENVTCYDEVPVADIDAIPDNIAAFCKGMEVLNLVPTDCNKQADVPSGMCMCTQHIRLETTNG